ncbi:hypothetical protein ES705_18776 [subsurface metagenome]
MSRKEADFPEDIIEFEDLFHNDYEAMNRFISFFKKVLEVFDTFKDVRVKELDLSKIIPETLKPLPFTYIITISSKEYLIFLINESKPFISKEELLDYKNVFTNNPSQVGIIIVWNDSKLSSIKLYRSEIYKDYEEIIEILYDKDRLLSLEELLNREIRFRERFSEVTVPPPTEDSTVVIIPNLEKELYDNINVSFNHFKTRRFREPKKDIMSTINIEDFEPIYSLFEEFLKEGIEIKEIDEIIKRFKLIKEEE